MHPLVVIGRQGCSGLRPISPRAGTRFLQWKSHKHGNAWVPLARRHHIAAIVVGGGPAGIATVGNLLTLIKPEEGKIFWVDRALFGGRIGEKYEEVPSNTKAELFSQFALALKPFQQIWDAAQKPNPLTRLRQLPQDETCSLSYAGGVLRFLTDALAMHPRVSARKGQVRTMAWDESTSTWTLDIQEYDYVPAGETAFVSTRSAPLVVLCTGAFPKTAPLPVKGPIQLPLDTALRPTELARAIPRLFKLKRGPLEDGRPITIGVIGASHSAILVLKNLFDLQFHNKADSPLKNIRVKWFTRHTKLKYAVYKEDWILYDNTGLKGTSAKFALRHLEGDNLKTNLVGKVITRVDCSGGEAAETVQFEKELPGCDFVVQAIGYQPHEWITMERGGSEKLQIAFDDKTGGFRDKDGEEIPGLFGAGIAYPERVTDPMGNVESAVGMWKFMKFLKRVVPAWIEKTRGEQGGSLGAKAEN